MAEKIEELSLPKAVVTRIIREALPERTILDKDVTTAISRCASMFILYITSLSQDEAKLSNKKTISGEDILNALKESEFGEMGEVLRQELEVFRSHVKAKKESTEVMKDDQLPPTEEAEPADLDG